MFTIYTSNASGDSSNCIYGNKVEITDEKSFQKAIRFDHVCGEFKGNYRSNDNFSSSDVLPMDCDNDHSDNPKEWVYPLDVSLAFPGCVFAVSYSRNNMKVKGTKTARPRFHIYFPIEKITDGKAYADLKVQIQKAFPYFDDGALGEARFLYGTENPEVEFYDGDTTIDKFSVTDDFADFDARTEEIGEGSRNNTMSHIAGKLIKRYGITDEAHEVFLEYSKKCNPPLSDFELDKIWHSASKFGKKVSEQDGYIPPEQFNRISELRPADFTDAGQAEVLAGEYGDILKYSPATHFLVYNGQFWEESDVCANRVIHELTGRQLEEAETLKKEAIKELSDNGGMDILLSNTPKKARSLFTKEQNFWYDKYEDALEYFKFVVKRRDSRYLQAALKEVRHMVSVRPQDIDRDEFLLNTPGGTYDLKKGIGSLREHDPDDYITKITEVNPSDKGMGIWMEALDTFFNSDKELIGYVQKIVGLAAVGKVYVEALIIAYGTGRNGKSTFWNVISKVMGSYSGNMSADVLTVGCRRNVKPELAEAKGKRLLIAAELEEGMRLSTSNIKQLCSTDDIYAEKKYKDPFSFEPTHTLVLYTNHLPRVGAIDKGTWRRLIIIPFTAVIEENSDVKNYADYLFDNSAEAILTWIIEGAEKVISENFKVDPPAKVLEAIKSYREDSDWFSKFLEDRCVVGDEHIEKSGLIYNEYRAYCTQTGEFIRNSAEFYTAIENEGFVRFRTSKGKFIKGLRLKSEFEMED